MASTDTFETTDQHVGEEHVEPVTLTINIEGATLTWTLSRHASHHYAELSTDEQASGSVRRRAANSQEEKVEEVMACGISWNGFTLCPRQPILGRIRPDPRASLLERYYTGSWPCLQSGRARPPTPLASPCWPKHDC